jgi:hypothetical protein
MFLSSVDWALRGGTGALVLLIGATLLRLPAVAEFPNS